MWGKRNLITTYMGLWEYFQKCIPRAKKKGYTFIISLIARYSDAQDLYDKLEKDWSSLNDLTNNKVLFVFSTPRFRNDASFYHKPYEDVYVGDICPFVVELKSNGQKVEDNFGMHEEENVDWKERHSQTISEFARNYNISEKDIPCLFFYDLVRDRYKAVPVEENENIYAFIKNILIWLANYESCIQKYKPIGNYYSLKKRLEGLVENDYSKQSVAIGQVLHEEKTYKEVKENIADSSIKRDLKRIGQWKRHVILPYGHGLSEENTYDLFKKAKTEIEEAYTLQWEHLENLKSKFVEENSEAKFMSDLFLACVQLHQNPSNSAMQENERNDYLRGLLASQKYSVLDQSRRGISATGKSAGEVDLLIQRDGFPITIIEALNLNCLDTLYLDIHLDKIFGYDASGNRFNVILVYVKVTNFNTFCEKYFKHIQEYEYSYPIKSAEDNLEVDGLAYSDIRIMKTIHDRNGVDTNLYHICMLTKEGEDCYKEN